MNYSKKGPCFDARFYAWALAAIYTFYPLMSSLSAQEMSSAATDETAFPNSYDLRGCKAGFEILWRYYRSLGEGDDAAADMSSDISSKSGRIFGNARQLREGTPLIGRFPSRQAIPRLPKQLLGSNRQTFALILWRDKMQDRVYQFNVQRNIDVYGKYYYPFSVQEIFRFPWELWNRQKPNTGCDEAQLFQAIPAQVLSNTVRRRNGRGTGNLQTFASLQIPPLQFIFRSQNAEVSQGEISQPNALGRADTTVLLPVNSAEQLCAWQYLHGERVIVPARQLAGSSAWRFRKQGKLPYGLTRLKIYYSKRANRPYPLAYASYNQRNYAVLADFENGYRLQYLQSGIQVSGTVLFWLESV
ncbi:MAG: hypothetical protein AAF975_09225, partial [Spirochaetota bacterium]